MLLFLFLAVTLLGRAAETESPQPAACKPGGFAILRFGNGPEARGKADGNFNVFFDAANYQDNAFDTALRAAMSDWTGAGGANWRYTFAGYTNAGADSRDGLLYASHGGRTFESGTLAVTLISAFADTGQIVDADIFVNPTFSFAAGSLPGDFDFQSVVLHEMGHALGLDHNDGCYQTRTVMQSALARGAQFRSLMPPEIDGVRYLYGGSGTGPGGGGGGGSGGGVSASPSSLAFSGVAGGPAPDSQAITIAGIAGTPFTALASTFGGGNWLSATPASGAAPGAVTVAIDTSALAAGFYTGRITINSQGISSDVTISLNLAAPAVTTLTVNPTLLTFSAVLGGLPPTLRTINLTGSTALPWTATASTSSGGSWLRVSPPNGTIPGALSVSVSHAGLAVGAYAGRITVAGGGLTREAVVQLEITNLPLLLIEPARISLSGRSGSTVPACANIAIRGSSGLPLDWTASAGASWLSVLPGSGRGPSIISVCAAAGSLAPGSYTANLAVSAPASNSPQTVSVAFAVTGAVAVTDGGVVSAATFAPGQPIAAGQLVSVFGFNLCSQTTAAESFPLPIDLDNCRVQIGGFPARLLYVSPGQLNLLTPGGLSFAIGSTTTLTVFNGNFSSLPVRVPVVRQAPGVFSLLGNGRGAGAITHRDGSPVSRAAPLAAGEAFSIYMTGIGPLDPNIADGTAAPTEPLSHASSSIRVLLDGQGATLLFAGAAPGFAGLHQIVAIAPDSLTRRFPELVVEVEGAPSNHTTAGGPSVLDISPASVPPGADATVIVRGINLASSSALRIGAENLPVALTADELLQTLRVTIPARLLTPGATLSLSVVDVESPGEHPSNSLQLAVGR